MKGSFGRDDYRELCELIIKYLGGQVLASSLYILKLALLANVCPRGLLTPNMLDGIDKMAQFIAIFHGPWYLQARIAAAAPRLDLQLWQDMQNYEVNISKIFMILYL